MKKILFLSLIISFRIFGQTPKMDVVVGTTENTDGIRAVLNKTNPTNNYSAITGENNSTNGIGYGVYGSHSGTGIGVSGYSTRGLAVSGTSYSGFGVYGLSEGGYGVFGITGGGYGVYGKTYGGTGIYGYSTTGNASQFISTLGGYALKTNGKIELGGLNGAGTNKFLKSTNLAGDADWSDLFPYSFSKLSSEPLLILTNTNTSSYNAAVFQSNTADSYSAVLGVAYNPSPTSYSRGVAGENYSTNSLGFGVFGSHAGTGSGVYGTSNGIGVQGISFSAGIGGKFSSESGYSLITNKGKVGFGNTAPNLNIDERVEINGRLRIRDSTSTAGVWFNNSANSINSADGAFYGMKLNTETGIWIGNAWRFWVNNAGNANFTGTVTATGFPIASDFRFKKNIHPLENTLSKVQKIVGVSYDLRKDEFPEKNFSDKPQIGFIAQDLEKIFPEMVFTDEKGYKSVDYARLTPVLVEAFKELILKNQTLETKNQTLKSRLDKIEAMLSTIQPNTENSNTKK